MRRAYSMSITVLSVIPNNTIKLCEFDRVEIELFINFKNYPAHNSQPIVAVAISPDSKYIASYSAQDNSLYIWQVCDCPAFSSYWAPDLFLSKQDHKRQYIQYWREHTQAV